mgnify:CR=1 FL=1
MNFKNKVIIVTGAARGLGQAYAYAFAKRGAKVIACDINSCDKTIEKIKNFDVEGLSLSVDVTCEKSTLAMVASVIEKFGTIDVLVNNAALYGNLTFVPFDKLDENEWDATMNVNVKGLWQCCKAVIPSMKKNKKGSIINISSLAATYGMPNALHYTTSKAAVIGLTRGLARELGRFNIRVNAVAPNVVNTKATSEVWGDKKDKLVEVTISQQAIKKPLEKDDIVGTVLFLASDQSRLTTGQTIMVDGGTVFL